MKPIMKMVKYNAYGKDFYRLDVDGYTEATTAPDPYGLKVLCPENCKAVERGYDIEELISAELEKLPYTKHLDDGQYNDGKLVGFEVGARWAFNKCLELMGDKKFSEEDMKKAYHKGFFSEKLTTNEWVEEANSHIQSLQQTEWDVEMEVVNGRILLKRI